VPRFTFLGLREVCVEVQKTMIGGGLQCLVETDWQWTCLTDTVEPEK
jgi:hypothetical protein